MDGFYPMITYTPCILILARYDFDDFTNINTYLLGLIFVCFAHASQVVEQFRVFPVKILSGRN